MIVLDTDHISLLERVGSLERERLLARLESPGVVAPCVTIISYEEQVRGWMARLAKAPSIKEEVDTYRRLSEQLQNYCALKILEFDERGAVEFQQLRKLKLRIGTMDLKIAAVVLAHGATLLTRNVSDFGRVPGLKIEDWSK